MRSTVLTVLALLVLLLFGLLGLGSAPSFGWSTYPEPAPAPAPRATITQTLFSVDGKGLDVRKRLRLREGQNVQFPHGTENVRLNRLECAHDVHAIRLRNGVSWRVPDLPTGEYLLSARILRTDVDYVVHVRSHPAPCPGG
jgi:hypothetical protein